MADNVGYTPGMGATVAADDVGGVLYQRVKISVGADGVAADLSKANPLPTTSGGYQSDIGVNSTLTPVTIASPFTGTGELNAYSDIGISAYSDVAGTLYTDFQNDGSDRWFTFPTGGFTVAAGIHEFHTAVKLTRRARVRFVPASDLGTVLEVFTHFGTFRQANRPIGTTINDDDDALVTKAIISGVGDTNATVTDHSALQVTAPPEGKSAFGEHSVAEPTPIVQLSFVYGTNPGQTDAYANASGSVTQANRMLLVSSGAAANSSGEMRSKRILKYNAGQGAMARFTALFTSGVANSTQMVGTGNESDGFFFGYNGTSFGVLHRRNGSPEIRTLTVTTKSSTAENITITLDGVTKSVAVTNGADTTVTANQIAAADYSSTGAGWSARAIGSNVEFKSWNAATHTGTYSLSGASTAVGTFAQNVAGVAPTETWIPQASWNGQDKFDGTGVTGVTLDPTKGNVYQIKYQWLGFGLITFFVEDPDDGELHIVHSIEYANANTTPSLGDPSLALLARAANASNTSNVVVKSASMAAFIEGPTNLIGYRLGVSNTKTTVTTSLLPIISVRQGQYRNSLAVQTVAKILRAALAVEHTKPITIKILEDATLVGASWQDVEAARTAIQYDTAATSLTGGRETFSVPLGKSSNTIADFLDDYFSYNLQPSRVITFAAIANSGTNGEVSVAVKMLERL